ncbi:hypothetical protein GH733_017552 [Mirounga leonina]|nr:hypothetical protein GH733_017552 [Mirounga leonina]
MWDHFKYRCQNLFVHEGGSRGEDVDMNSNRCLENIALQLRISPSKNSSRRNQNCATKIPLVVEISSDKDNDSCVTLGARFARRESYSVHAPWGGKKKHSCSTKTQSALDTDKKFGRTSKEREAPGTTEVSGDNPAIPQANCDSEEDNHPVSVVT